MRTIKVGSRQSALALTQTGHVIQDLRDICEREGLAFDFEVHKIVTKGDLILDVTLSKVGAKVCSSKRLNRRCLIVPLIWLCIA